MDSSGSVFWFALIQGWFMATATLNGPLKKMRLFIINTFQSAADQLCLENDEDRWFFCVWLTCRCRLVYFTRCYCLEKRSYAVEDGLSGFLFWELLKVKKGMKGTEKGSQACLTLVCLTVMTQQSLKRGGASLPARGEVFYCKICDSAVESPKLF